MLHGLRHDRFLDSTSAAATSRAEELASGLDLESNLWRTVVRVKRISPAELPVFPRMERAPLLITSARRSSPACRGGRHGDQILGPFLHGGERNRYFLQRGGRSFVESRPFGIG